MTDGVETLEFRSPAEVFKADSLATLQDAPLLEGHPAMVDPSNWASYSRGHVSGIPRQDGDFVAGTLAVQAGSTLARIDAGEASELSCGYVCKTRPWSGEWQGKHYDGIVEQYDIRYNHVGLGPKNWGRAGNDVSLRLDGGVCEHEQPKEPKKMLVRFDGKDYEAGSNEYSIAILTKLDATEAALTAEKSARETADGKVAALTEQNAKLTANLTTANDPKRLDAAIAERVKLVTDAAKVLGDKFDFAGKSALEIQTAVVAAATPNVKLDGKSADFVAGAFETALLSGVRVDGIDAVPGRLADIEARRMQEATKTRNDAAEKARQDLRTPQFEMPAGSVK
jgi:hypothetical protein